jgi:adenylate cyclase
VIGDTVNLASRLEGANKEYGTGILVSHDTWERAKDAVEAREIDAVRVVGKTEPVRVYELLARKGELDGTMLSLKENYEDGLRRYRARDWDGAEAAFKRNPDDAPSKVMLARIALWRHDPRSCPADGVWDLTKK